MHQYHKFNFIYHYHQFLHFVVIMNHDHFLTQLLTPLISGTMWPCLPLEAEAYMKCINSIFL